jgi:hypothetical protein
LLEVPLDDLVLADDPYRHPPDQPEPTDAGPAQVGDDHLLVGLLATYNGLAVTRVLGLLGWTRPRLDAALAVIGEHLAATALCVVATDERLTLVPRPDVIPAVVGAQFEHDHLIHHPLDPNTAVAVLALVREKILEPFPEHEAQHPYTRPTSFDAAHLVSRRVAVPTAASPADGTDTTKVDIHPDVMFALELADSPAGDNT